MTSEDRVKELKRKILRAAYTAQEGHIASAFSVLDILYVLYAHVMKVSPSFVKHQARDCLILSKGHASLALYAVLEEIGFLMRGELNTFGKGRLGGHPCEELVPGVEASTGSLGHGLPIAVGQAMALLKGQLESRVFCIIGDGEMNEGSIWESLLLAGHRRLTNLTVILDYNRSNDRALRLPISGRGASDILCNMGWRVSSIDGHDHSDISRAFTRVIDNRPHFVVANTVKGKGISEMEKDPHAWHHRAPTAEELALFLEELK
jgi:transketolase